MQLLEVVAISVEQDAQKPRLYLGKKNLCVRGRTRNVYSYGLFAARKYLLIQYSADVSDLPLLTSYQVSLTSYVNDV